MALVDMVDCIRDDDDDMERMSVVGMVLECMRERKDAWVVHAQMQCTYW